MVSVRLNVCPVYVDERSSCEKISKDKQGFVERVFDCFGRDLRRLQLLFLGDVRKFC